MDLDAIETRANLTDRIRATIAKIDAKPWKGTDEERQQFEAEAIMRAHVGPELDALVARVREVEEENTRLRHELAVARGETVGTIPTWAEYAKAEHERKEREAEWQPKPRVTLEQAREMAAQARARQLKEET